MSQYNSKGLTVTAKKYFLATRPAFLTAPVLPYCVGAIWGGLAAGHFDYSIFGLAMLAIISVHAAANVLNDVIDERTGNDTLNTDRIFPFTGGSRFIQNAVLSPGRMMALVKGLLVVSVLLGGILVVLKGPAVLFFGLCGVALGVFYSLPPVSLSARGLGEVSVGLATGLLPLVGGSWLQSGGVDLDVLMLSVPASMWVMAILLINEFPDRRADAQVNRNTFVVRFGVDSTRHLYVLLHAVALTALGVLTIVGSLPIWGISYPVLMMIAAVMAAKHISVTTDAKGLRQAIIVTLGLHATGCMWLAGTITSLFFSE